MATKQIKNAIESRKDVLIFGTTDLTHAGPWYKELPPQGISLIEYVKKRDAPIIDCIVNCECEQ